MLTFEVQLQVVEDLGRPVDSRGLTLTELSLRWLLSEDHVNVVFIGSTRLFKVDILLSPNDTWGGDAGVDSCYGCLLKSWPAPARSTCGPTSLPVPTGAGSASTPSCWSGGRGGGSTRRPPDGSTGTSGRRSSGCETCRTSRLCRLASSTCSAGRCRCSHQMRSGNCAPSTRRTLLSPRTPRSRFEGDPSTFTVDKLELLSDLGCTRRCCGNAVANTRLSAWPMRSLSVLGLTPMSRAKAAGVTGCRGVGCRWTLAQARAGSLATATWIRSDSTAPLGPC